jgi:hypothetical protein
MNLQAVREEIAARLATIEGLNTFPYRPDKIVPPAAFPDLPERIDYDGSYERGMDAMPLPVNVLVGKMSAQASHEQIAAYVAGEGPRSFKATLDSSPSNPYTSCDDVHVKSVEFAIFTIAGVDYLAASFSVDITGNGA